MSVQIPAHRIPRQSVAGAENEWVKMFDPPTESPPTPEFVAPTNPVPGLMPQLVPGARVFSPGVLRRELMHGEVLTMWDGKPVTFFMFSDPDIDAASNGTWPAPTIRVPRGVIFHGETHGKGPPPHTIHWHGIEPTAINDGVGHCSMELGTYTYQWQPNFIGTYFYHCHRNTMQHFEFGLYGMLLIEPPDAYDRFYPIDVGGPAKGLAPGVGAGGYPRRTAANLDPAIDSAFAKFGQTAAERVPLTTPDPRVPALYGTYPHAYTVKYDVEALWVLDDRDSAWSDFMSNARATFPVHGTQPGVNDQFFKGDFHDFNPDYFFVTGVPFPARVGETGICASKVVVPPDLNSGVTGMQVPINAQRNQTVLVRVLDAAYCSLRISFPIDVAIIAFDGRALGVPPFAGYNHAFLLPKNTPYELSTARRFDCLIRETQAFSGHATVEFIDVQGGEVHFTGKIPINIV